MITVSNADQFRESAYSTAKACGQCVPTFRLLPQEVWSLNTQGLGLSSGIRVQSKGFRVYFRQGSGFRVGAGISVHGCAFSASPLAPR